MTTGARCIATAAVVTTGAASVSACDRAMRNPGIDSNVQRERPLERHRIERRDDHPACGVEDVYPTEYEILLQQVGDERVVREVPPAVVTREGSGCGHVDVNAHVVRELPAGRLLGKRRRARRGEPDHAGSPEERKAGDADEPLGNDGPLGHKGRGQGCEFDNHRAHRV